MKCRNCNYKLSHTFVDLGKMPIANEYLKNRDEFETEKKYSLKIFVCENCFLVQTEDILNEKEIFKDDYSYFSSTSISWLEHCRIYSEHIIKQYDLTENSFVVEIASNDGYLLKNFQKNRIPCVGIEPTLDTANFAKSQNLSIINDFFNLKLSKQISKDYKKANLIIANNVLAHVPNLTDFCDGLKELLDGAGVITIEVPHLLNMLKYNLFDTIYHEHFSYFSLTTLMQVMNNSKLKIFDCEKLNTHGGSLRIHCCHFNDKRSETKQLHEILSEEMQYNLNNINTYKKFQSNVDNCKKVFVEFINKKIKEKKKIVGYGAAAKGNTFLNYCEINYKIIGEIYDNAHSKQNKFFPGTHIPIVSPIKLHETKPDLIIILPWNLKIEIIKFLKSEISWKCDFVTIFPKLEIVSNQT